MILAMFLILHKDNINQKIWETNTLGDGGGMTHWWGKGGAGTSNKWGKGAGMIQGWDVGRETQPTGGVESPQ